MACFQSTLPRGERPNASGEAFGAFDFQSTLPRGERHNQKRKEELENSFNPRSREGSDAKTVATIEGRPSFQSTLPRGERPRTGYRRCTSCKSFNPRSREGSDGTTLDHVPDCRQPFNPRSREGSDHTPLVALEHSSAFNPRSREGSDIWQMRQKARYILSIHAPARGATSG